MEVILIIALAVSLCYLALVLYFLTGWIRLEKNPGALLPGQVPSVSIVVPVRNEAERIAACLDALQSQDYPAGFYEIIVIDDFSTDGTLGILREYQAKGIKVFSLKDYLGYQWENTPNKKKAISLGIKNASGDLVVTTDGDTLSNTAWLRTLVSYYVSNDYKLVTAPVILKPARWPFEIFQQLDVFSLAGITGATLRNHQAVMCNGANMIYEKKTFQEVEGFKGNHDVPTGDDIFLMQKIWSRYPGKVAFLASVDATISAAPVNGIGGFVNQRTRWASKSVRYQGRLLPLILGLVYFYFVGVVYLGISAAISPEWFLIPFLAALGVKLVADLMFTFPVVVFFKKWYVAPLIPFASVFHLLYVLLIGPLSISGRYYWKDRRVR